MQWRDNTTLPTAALRDFSPLNVRMVIYVRFAPKADIVGLGI
jgi:hypothetical protein